MRIGLAVVAVLLCGCDLYFGGGGDDVVCNGGGGPKEVPAYQGRNPDTGVCESVGGGWCDEECGPCPAVDIAQPDWGACYSQCSDLDELSCFGTSGCYAAYLDDPTADGKRDYWGCWQTALSGPIQGACTNLDAHTCSRHDNCIAIYEGKTDAQNTNYEGTRFLQCANEPFTGSCDAADCSPGYHCEQQCYPDEMNGGICTGVCVMDNSCANVDCGPGYTCTEQCEMTANGLQCSPVCVPMNPGDCYGPVACDALPPACPSGTLPGIINGCWSGYCIPTSQCGSPACETLATESACVARMDCMPVYEGTDCTCYPNGCECQVLTYERCEPL